MTKPELTIHCKDCDEQVGTYTDGKSDCSRYCYQCEAPVSPFTVTLKDAETGRIVDELHTN